MSETIEEQFQEKTLSLSEIDWKGIRADVAKMKSGLSKSKRQFLKTAALTIMTAAVGLFLTGCEPSAGREIKPTPTLVSMATVIAEGTPKPLLEQDPFFEALKKMQEASTNLWVWAEEGGGRPLNSRGTAFFIQSPDGRWFLATVSHMLEDLHRKEIFDFGNHDFREIGSDKVINFEITQPGKSPQVKFQFHSSDGVFGPPIFKDPGQSKILSPEWDVALFPVLKPEVFSSYFEPLVLAPRDALRVGEEVIFGGYPWTDFEDFYSYKAVLLREEKLEGGSIWVMKGRSWFGFSGGPVANKQGKVIGLIRATFDEIDEGRIAPVDRIWDLIERN